MQQLHSRRGGPSGAAANSGAVPALRGPRGGNRGTASVLAMLYMILFSSVALGFYATVSMSAQAARNDAHCFAAQAAAESGVQFLRFHLARLDLPPDTAADKVMDLVYQQLAKRLEGTPNLGTRRVGYVNGVVSIPEGASQYISLDKRSQGFRALVSASAGRVKVKVVGTSGVPAALRAVEMEFSRSQNGSEIFDYGVAANGPIQLGSGTVVTGVPDAAAASLFSKSATNPAVSVASNSTLAGRIYLSESGATASLASSASVGGSSIPSIREGFVYPGKEAPPFPAVDTSEYWPFVLKADGTPNYSNGSGKTLVNCVLKPGSYHFSSQMTIQGVLYIQTPCSITFGGGVSIKGVVVVQNKPTGTLTQNVLDFQGNGHFEGVETLPDNDPAFPAALRAKAGSLILAPNFTVNFGGNFETVGGSIVGGAINFGGTSTGTVRGTVIGLSTSPLTASGKQLLIDHTGMVRTPPGLVFGYCFMPDFKSYAEVAP